VNNVAHCTDAYGRLESVVVVRHDRTQSHFNEWDSENAALESSLDNNIGILGGISQNSYVNNLESMTDRTSEKFLSTSQHAKKNQSKKVSSIIVNTQKYS
jgi:hypothetical protein